MLEKDKGIESLRGIAIILVVAFHISNDAPLATQQMTFDYLAYTFQNIRMPLFTVISGYLYAVRPLKSGEYFRFLRGKTRRILIPLFVVVSLQYLATSLLPGVNNPTSIDGFWQAHLYSYGHFWFLQVIFIIFVLIGIIDSFEVVRDFKMWVLVFLFSCNAHLWFHQLNIDITIFSFEATWYLFVYFILGYGIAKFSEKLDRENLRKYIIIVFLFSITLQHLFWVYGIAFLAGKRTVLGLIISISFCLLVVIYRKPMPILQNVGAYAFSIYLYQVFGSGVGRRIAMNIPSIGPYLYFFIVIFVTVSFGIVLEMIVSKIPKVRTLMLGLK